MYISPSLISPSRPFLLSCQFHHSLPLPSFFPPSFLSPHPAPPLFPHPPFLPFPLPLFTSSLLHPPQEPSVVTPSVHEVDEEAIQMRYPAAQVQTEEWRLQSVLPMQLPSIYLKLSKSRLTGFSFCVLSSANISAYFVRCHRAGCLDNAGWLHARSGSPPRGHSPLCVGRDWTVFGCR